LGHQSFPELGPEPGKTLSAALETLQKLQAQQSVRRVA
jgi:hypothetical protein